MFVVKVRANGRIVLLGIRYLAAEMALTPCVPHRKRRTTSFVPDEMLGAVEIEHLCGGIIAIDKWTRCRRGAKVCLDA
jgi:hypothetical protein